MVRPSRSRQRRGRRSARTWFRHPPTVRPLLPPALRSFHPLLTQPRLVSSSASRHQHASQPPFNPALATWFHGDPTESERLMSVLGQPNSSVVLGQSVPRRSRYGDSIVVHHHSRPSAHSHRSSSSTGTPPSLSLDGASAPSSGYSVPTQPGLGAQFTVRDHETGIIYARREYRCLFENTGCNRVCSSPDEWRGHQTRHLRGNDAPTRFKCPDCGDVITSPGPRRAWKLVLDHCLDHYGLDRQLVRRTEHYESHWYDYLWRKKIIDNQVYRDLTSNQGVMITTGQFVVTHQRQRRGHG